jgi:RNA polymerase sigma factor (sigma-70 family)
MGSAAERKRFEKIYHEHYDAIWRYVHFKGAGLDPDNIIGDVFATAWEKRKAIPEEMPRAWLYKVANNKIMNAVSGKVKQSMVGQQRGGEHDNQLVDDPAVAVIEKLTFEQVLKSLDSDQDREILFLLCHEGFGPTEIAKILGLNRTTVSMRIKRLNDKLAAFRPTTAGPSDDVNNDEPETRSEERRKQ